MFVKILISIFFAGVLSQNVQKPCPDGWALRGKTCFWYSQNTQRNWLNANRYCQDIGGTLAGTYSTTDLSFVANMSANPLYSVWTGLYKKLDYWTFLDDTLVTNLAEQWLPGEPLANQGTCGAIRSVDPIGYFNVQCLNVQPFLCSQKIATCDTKNLTDAKGQIQSPNFPNNYANNENCIQYIIGNDKNFIELTFDAWSVEAIFDYVTLYDGMFPNGMYSVIANLTYDPTNITDSNPKPTFQSTSNIMTVKFVTDTSTVKTGWHANYTQKPYLPEISQTGSSGVLTSPNYPNNYPNDAEQYSYINTLGGTRIVLQFTDFRTEKNRDFLYVYDGGDRNAPLLGNFTGDVGDQYPRQQLVSSSNIMTLFFYSDYSYNFRGYSATWRLM